MAEYVETYDLHGNCVLWPKKFWDAVTTDPQFKKWPRSGMYLYYKDKNTGVIMRGEVLEVGKYEFLFGFGSRQVWLDKSIIGLRLFDTKEEALWYDQPDLI